MEKKELSAAEAARRGVGTLHEVMQNGEARFRLTNKDGNDYIRTEAGATGAWQNAHFHSDLMETYVVESGWMAMAEVIDNQVRINVYRPNDVITTRPLVAHNVYLPAGSIIHTIKHGSNRSGDWMPANKLTKQTIDISEEEILSIEAKR